jgi:hypothetical protein
MTATNIAVALTRPDGPFPYRRYVVVPNVSFGMGLNHEADLLAMSAAGVCTEVEIKISVADLRRDSLKRKWHRWSGPCIIRRIYFTAPEAMEAALIEHAPKFAGIYVVTESGGWRLVRRAIDNRLARKLDDRERFQLARLGAMRYWTRTHGDAP